MSEEAKTQISDLPLDECELRRGVAFLRQLPTFNAAAAIGNLYDGKRGADVCKMRELLAMQCDALSAGDLGRLEAMLTTKAHVLDSIFNKYIGVAAHSEQLNQFQCFAGIALKAQNQCRQTISVLGELKNPKRSTFIKQQNNAVNQQINQCGQLESEKPGVETQKIVKNIPLQANELLESNNEWLDRKTPTAAEESDSSLGTVEALNRADYDRR